MADHAVNGTVDGRRRRPLGFQFDTAGTGGTITPHSIDLEFPKLIGPDGLPLKGRDKDTRAIGLAMPHALTFIARQVGGQNTYWHDRFDECLRFNRQYAETMRNDGFLNGLLQERMLAVYKLRHSWHLEIPDEKDPFQVRVRDAVTAIIKGIPFFGRMLWAWLDAIWYGKNAVQVQWGWRKSPDHQKPKALTVLDWMPVQGDKIGHQFLDEVTGHYVDQPYVLIDSAYSNYLTQRENAKIIVTTLGQALVLQGNWRERFIIHKHLVEDSDWFFSDKAEAIHGVGVRSKIFWANWLKWEWMANVTDFFDRVGLGITVWRYPTGNNQALAAVQKAANEQSNRAHIFVPITPDATKDQSGIERIEVPTSGADFLLNLIQYLDTIIERYVVGQEASSKGVSAGMGNEATADFQKGTKDNITLMDADFVAETITGAPRDPGMVDTIQRYTYPEADFPMMFRFDQESGESEKKLTGIKTVVDMGVKVKAAEVRRAAGLSKPVDGDEVVQGNAGMPGAPGAGITGGPPGAQAGPAGPGGVPQPGESGQTIQGAPGGEENNGAESDLISGKGGPEEAPAPQTAAEESDTGMEQTPGGFLESLQHARTEKVLQFNKRVEWTQASGVSPGTGRTYSGNRWINNATGKVRYFPKGSDPNARAAGLKTKEDTPKAAEPAAPAPPAHAAPKQPETPRAPRAAAAGRPSVQDMAGRIKGLGTEYAIPQVKDLAAKLSEMTVGELKQLGKELGWGTMKGQKMAMAHELAHGELQSHAANA